ANLAQDPGLFASGLEAWAGLGGNHVGVAAVDQLIADVGEGVRVRHFPHELAAFLAFLLFLLQPLLAIRIGLLAPLIDDLLNFVIFFGRFFLGERFPILGHQPVHGVAINLQDVIVFSLGGSHCALAVELVFLLSFGIGVVVHLLVVFEIVLCNFLDKVLDLVGGEGCRNRGFRGLADMQTLICADWDIFGRR